MLMIHGRTRQGRWSLGLRSSATAAMLVAASFASTAAAGDLSADGTLSLEVNLRFPPAQADLDDLTSQLRAAQLQLCDATDGAVKLSSVRVTTGEGNEANGDVWWFQSPGRAYAGGALGSDTGRFVIYGSGPGSSLRGDVLAHELGHLVFGLGDAYDEQRRSGGCGQGVSIEVASTDPALVNISATDNTMMQQFDAQFCVNNRGEDHRAAGDPRIGPVACFDSGDCANLDNLTYATDPADPSTAIYDTCGYPDLSSELATSANSDLLRATGDSCPGPLAANRFKLDGHFRPGDAFTTICDNTASDAGEQCQTGDVEDCGSFGLTPGTSVACNACRWDLSVCARPVPNTCGDGTIDAGEECDGAALGGLTCEDFDLISGALSCRPNCMINLSACTLPPFDAFDPATFETAAATSGIFHRYELFDPLGRVEGQAGQFLGESNHLLDVYVRKFSPDNWTLIVAMDAESFGGASDTLQEVARFNLEFSGAVLDAVNGEPVDASGASLATGDFPTVTLGGDSATGFTPFGSLTNTAGGQTAGTGPFAAHTDGSVPPAMTLDLVLGGIVQDDLDFYQAGFVFFSNLSDGPGLSELVHLDAGGSERPQRATCTSEPLCNAAWNATTQRFEGTHQTTSQVLGGSAVRDDWDVMAEVLDTRYGLLVNPPDVVQPAAPSVADCGGLLVPELGDVTIPDQVMMVLDRSGSMAAASNRAFAGEETRLEFAQAAARAYVALSKDRPVQVGLVSFSSTAEEDVSLTLIGDAPGQTTVQDFSDVIDSSVPDGLTAISSALQLAGDLLDGAAMGTKAVLFLSDGEKNPPPGDTQGEPRDVAQALRDEKGITIFTVPVGDSADRGLFADLADATRGKVLDAPTGNELPAIFVEAFARVRGETLVLDRTPSAVERQIIIGSNEAATNEGPLQRWARSLRELWLPGAVAQQGLPISETFQIPVEAGGQRLDVMLSAREMPVDNWTPAFELRDPTGAVVASSSCEGCSGIIRDPFFDLLLVQSPMAGTWELRVSALAGTGPQRSYVVAHVENPGPDCFADASPRVIVPGQSLTVTASAAQGGLIRRGAAFTGQVVAESGASFPLSFTPSFDGVEHTASVPAAALDGRGIYKVFVSCSVNGSAAVEEGEPVFANSPPLSAVDAAGNSQTFGEFQPINREIVHAFERTTQAFFFLDSPTPGGLPPGDDADRDGIPNDEEPPGDTDGDGRPDVFDDDADNDDVTDFDDPDPLDPNVPIPRDAEPPVLTVPPNATLTSCALTTETLLLDTATAVDAVDPAPTVIGEVIVTNGQPLEPAIPVVGGAVALGVGVHTIRWTATDASGNASVGFQTVTLSPGLFANGSFLLRDRASARTEALAPAAIANRGSGQTELGVEAASASIQSIASVFLRDRSNVAGSVTSSGNVFVGNGVVVGPISTFSPVPLPPFPVLNVTFPPSQGDINLEPDQLLVLAPGSYGTVSVKPRARLVLRGGVYHMARLQGESDARIEIDPSNGPIDLFVSTEFRTRGLQIPTSIAPDDFFVGYVGSQEVFVETAFEGEILAPSAKVTFGAVPGVRFGGRFSARDIEARTDTQLICRGNLAQ